MSLKVKLTSTILAFMLILGLMVMGVFASSTAKIELGGNLSFTATNVHAQVDGVISGAETNPELKTLLFKEGKTTEEETSFKTNYATWTDCDLTFKSTGDAVSIVITITNLADRPLYATINPASKMSSGVTSTMLKVATADATTGDDYTGDVITINNLSTVYVRLTMTLNNLNASLASNAEWGYDIDLSNDKPASILQFDSENGYYFVEMGTYNNNPVRWRLISTDGESQFVGNGTNAPASGQGWFIQETMTITSAFVVDEYDDNGDVIQKNNGDYSDAGIRNILKAYSTTLSITADDPIYSKIQSRSMNDMYVDINWEGVEATCVISSEEEKNDASEDMFWCLSVKELYTLVCGGTITEIDGVKYTSTNWRGDIYNNQMWNDTYYWLRTSVSTQNGWFWIGGGTGEHVGENMDLLIESMTGYDDSIYLRPAFILNF